MGRNRGREGGGEEKEEKGEKGEILPGRDCDASAV